MLRRDPAVPTPSWALRDTPHPPWGIGHAIAERGPVGKETRLRLPGLVPGLLPGPPALSAYSSPHN
jgi:hypothetical protein